MTLPIALQLYTVRDAMAQSVPDTLEAVAAMGYEYVEFAGLFDQHPAVVRRVCDDLGLKVVSAHAGFERLTAADAFDALEHEVKTLGAAHVVCPGIFGDAATWTEALDGLAAANARCQRAGLTLAYHNHAFEFDPIAGHPDAARPFDLIFDHEDALASELDIAWAHVAGEDVVGLLNRLAGRVPLLHVKDAHESLHDADRPTFTEVATGVVPIKAALDRAEAVGVKYLLVEQDGDWINGDPLASAKTSHDNLQQLLGEKPSGDREVDPLSAR